MCGGEGGKGQDMRARKEEENNEQSEERGRGRETLQEANVRWKKRRNRLGKVKKTRV